MIPCWNGRLPTVQDFCVRVGNYVVRGVGRRPIVIAVSVLGDVARRRI